MLPRTAKAITMRITFPKNGQHGNLARGALKTIGIRYFQQIGPQQKNKYFRIFLDLKSGQTIKMFDLQSTNMHGMGVHAIITISITIVIIVTIIPNQYE